MRLLNVLSNKNAATDWFPIYIIIGAYDFYRPILNTKFTIKVWYLYDCAQCNCQRELWVKTVPQAVLIGLFELFGGVQCKDLGV